MATTTFHDYTGDGADKTFDYFFPTFSASEVVVEVGGVIVDNYTIPNYATSGTKTVTFDNSTGTLNAAVCESDGAPKNALLVRVRRQTNVDSVKAAYQAGSSLKAADLTSNNNQLLRAAQDQMLKADTITESLLKDGSISSSKIANNTIVNADINTSAAIAGTKINPAFGSQNLSLTGNITVSGTVDGRDVSADGTKLDGIEASATADQTAAEIRTLVGNASDSNVFTDADHSKLDGIEASATADQTASEIRTLVENASDSNVFTDADHSKLNAIEAGATQDQTAGEIRALVEAASDSNVFTDADHTKLNGIEASATADQTAAEIRTLVGNATDSNVFTDAEKTKLNAIESGATADQTAAEIRTLVNSASDSNVFTDADHTKLDGIETGATADQTASDISSLGFSTLTGSETLTNKTLTTPVINDMSGTAVVTSGTSTSDNKVYSAKRSDELYSTQASQAATSATAAANSATAAASSQSAAASSATAAASSANTASTQATNAAASATSAESDLNTFKGQYFGALASDPVTDPLSNAINQGDIYFNTTSEQVRIFNGSAFQGISENSVDASRFATSDFSALYTASAGSNSINLGGLAISGAVFSTENIPSTRASLAKGSATYNLGGI